MNIAKIDDTNVDTNILILVTKSPRLRFNGALEARPCRATAGLEINTWTRSSSVAVLSVA
jgi:hypothetical protein